MAMGPNAPCQDSLIAFVSPVLQTQDGSFVGECSGGMVAFDASGNVRWVVPNCNGSHCFPSTFSR